MIRIHDQEAVGRLLAQEPLGADGLRRLVLVLFEGFLRCRTARGAGVAYPGFRGSGGVVVDRLEGFSRNAAMMAAYVAGRRSPIISARDGQRVDLRQLILEGALAGTQPNGREYWGDIGDFDQRTCEAADVALALWLLNQASPLELSVKERAQVFGWLAQTTGKETVDNNWHLFVAQVHSILRDLGEPHSPAEIETRYRRAKSFYAGKGWFRDGPDGPVDYYSAWGFAYHLFWLEQVLPGFDSNFIKQAIGELSQQLRHFICKSGYPLFGRSLCYRLAMPVPLVCAVALGDERQHPGEARRALSLVYGHFLNHGAVRNGRITQGVYGDDPRLLDNYSGPASALWCLRPLVAALCQPDDAPFWQSPERRLPAEDTSYEMEIEPLDGRIRAHAASGYVELIFERGADAAALEPYTVKSRLRCLLTGEPSRPDNEDCKYGLSSYRSDQPFFRRTTGGRRLLGPLVRQIVRV